MLPQGEAAEYAQLTLYWKSGERTPIQELRAEADDFRGAIASGFE
jgi:hypothetical protein